MSRGVIVLAGGNNSRMGREKWLLRLDGRTVLERIIETFIDKVDSVTVVLPYGSEGRDESVVEQVTNRLGAALTRDEEGGVGPLAGVLAGFRHSQAEWNLIAASDMPFVQWPVAERLFAVCETSGADGAIPVRMGRAHPLFAVYRRTGLGPLEAYRQEGGRKVMEWAGRLHTVEVTDEQLSPLDPEGVAFFNMNTKEDYEIAQGIVIQRNHPLI
jgi:molybdopterin-guanine dinucleotide biosynthesis protein A